MYSAGIPGGYPEEFLFKFKKKKKKKSTRSPLCTVHRNINHFQPITLSFYRNDIMLIIGMTSKFELHNGVYYFSCPIKWYYLTTIDCCNLCNTLHILQYFHRKHFFSLQLSIHSTFAPLLTFDIGYLPSSQDS